MLCVSNGKCVRRLGWRAMGAAKVRNLNAILTGILTRKREFAVLQSIGMTGKQLKAMLVWEGVFWFYTYHPTVTPILLLVPAYGTVPSVR